MDSNGLLTEIRELVVRVDERTEQHTEQISALFAKQNEACAKLATLEERTKTHKEQLGELRRSARQTGGAAGAGVTGVLVIAWEFAKAFLRGDGGP